MILGSLIMMKTKIKTVAKLRLLGRQEFKHRFV